jgi:hypothetical protein
MARSARSVSRLTGNGGRTADCRMECVSRSVSGCRTPIHRCREMLLVVEGTPVEVEPVEVDDTTESKPRVP